MKATKTSGVVYPLAWLDVLQQCDTLAELKIIGVVWGYDGVIGIDCEALSFTELLHRTGLSKRSLSEGLKKVVSAGWIRHDEAGSKPVYLPSTKSIPHDHDIMINLDSFELIDSKKEHDHEAQKVHRQKIYDLLVYEFGMGRSEKVAQDLAFSPKYTVQTLETQIRYARWEKRYGRNSDKAQPILNPAGHLVARLRENKPKPKGYSHVQALVEFDGFVGRDELFWAIYNGEIDDQAIKDTFEYSSWLYELMEAEQENA